jgi:hypothetical protein
MQTSIGVIEVTFIVVPKFALYSGEYNKSYFNNTDGGLHFFACATYVSYLGAHQIFTGNKIQNRYFYLFTNKHVSVITVLRELIVRVEESCLSKISLFFSFSSPVHFAFFHHILFSNLLVFHRLRAINYSLCIFFTMKSIVVHEL